jgi:hypothetical protein
MNRILDATTVETDGSGFDLLTTDLFLLYRSIRSSQSFEEASGQERNCVLLVATVPTEIRLGLIECDSS